MPSDLIALPALECGTLHDIHARPVMALHVEIDRHEVPRTARAEVASDRQRFEKDLGHDHGASEVQYDTAVVQIGECGGEASKNAMARVADRGATRRRMLMNDLGAECRVHGGWNSATIRREEHRELGLSEVVRDIEHLSEGFAHPSL